MQSGKLSNNFNLYLTENSKRPKVGKLSCSWDHPIQSHLTRRRMFTTISSIPTGQANARADAVLGMTKLSSPMERGARCVLQRLHTKRREGQTMEVPRASYGGWREVQRNFKTLDSTPGLLHQSNRCEFNYDPLSSLYTCISPFIFTHSQLTI